MFQIMLNRFASAPATVLMVFGAFLCPLDDAQAASTSTITGTATVIDADTIDIHGARIRLQAVDAIESRQRCTLPNGKEWRCGTDSANALAKKIGRAPVECRVSGKDRYGRFVARCFQKGEDLNAWLVANGWAVAYRQYGREYVPQENAARKAKRGVWASRFVMPWDWRRGQR
ncbi:MAG: thermonuclease family protein [Paracoccaceae bacterium]|nr:thermonuclease family protein [Paracoccaceae bacterium]